MSQRVAVVIPACNEEERVVRCVESVAGAVHALLRAESDARVSVILAADSCTDRTVGAAREAWAAASSVLNGHAELEVLEGTWASAGGARQAAANHALRLGADWIASTDADTAVPQNWLSYQVERARTGVDAVLGTVEPDPTECPEHVFRLWHLEHDLSEGHPYIHAANMGVRAGAFQPPAVFRTWNAARTRPWLKSCEPTARAWRPRTGSEPSPPGGCAAEPPSVSRTTCATWRPSTAPTTECSTDRSRASPIAEGLASAGPALPRVSSRTSHCRSTERGFS